jgi:hypothetical protein
MKHSDQLFSSFNILNERTRGIMLKYFERKMGLSETMFTQRLSQYLHKVLVLCNYVGKDSSIIGICTLQLKMFIPN